MEGSTKKIKTDEDVNNFLNEVAGNQFLKLPKDVLIHIILIDKTLKVKDIIKMSAVNVFFKNLTEHEYSDEEGERWRGIFEILFIRRYGKPELDRVKLLETNGPVRMSQRYLIMLMIDFMFTNEGINYKDMLLVILYQNNHYTCNIAPGIILKEKYTGMLLVKLILPYLHINFRRFNKKREIVQLNMIASSEIDKDVAIVIKDILPTDMHKEIQMTEMFLQATIDMVFFKEHPTIMLDIIYKIYSYYLSNKDFHLKKQPEDKWTLATTFSSYLNDIQSQYCENCFEKTATLMCSSCENVSYCSQRCGEKNWKQIHQHVCN
jgi:hypothetical protein